MIVLKFTGVYPKNSLLFVEGEEPRGVFILCSGRVKLTTSSTDGKRLILKIVEAGEVLGLSAAILDRPYEVTAETIQPSQVNFIKRDDFLKFLASYSEAAINTAALVERPGTNWLRLKSTATPTQNCGPGRVRRNPVKTGSPV